MSELDLILKRKRNDSEHIDEKKESSSEQEKETKQDITQENKIELSLQVSETKPTPEVKISGEEVKHESGQELQVKQKMREFIEKDPKIGVWSYPAFLVLQYLYHTVPSFKMSRVAKEALEKGLSEMYPDLFKIATELAKEEKKI
ncbi:hypothetical protein [Stygiolobus caldivivus]|uniref:Uncharacterized protein n=1 Tax=Stygiolobus caldivivus TaxID=2824673 RepID=A0A8D5U5W4_9CREN|nr:hypothetical protein [Stygiolobus caldivivus]BCU69444.1 hypothetical protein KN1_07410 [Stygiolobus caldivivus]